MTPLEIFGVYATMNCLDHHQVISFYNNFTERFVNCKQNAFSVSVARHSNTWIYFSLKIFANPFYWFAPSVSGLRP